jgi:hypothetical protein
MKHYECCFAIGVNISPQIFQKSQYGPEKVEKTELEEKHNLK